MDTIRIAFHFRSRKVIFFNDASGSLLCMSFLDWMKLRWGKRHAQCHSLRGMLSKQEAAGRKAQKQSDWKRTLPEGMRGEAAPLKGGRSPSPAAGDWGDAVGLRTLLFKDKRELVQEDACKK